MVAPNLDLKTVARDHDTLLLPGVFTATEGQTAHTAGCRLVRLFPADALGPNYLRALRAPLDDVGFVPTGGVDPETIGAFQAAGAAAFGIGSYLVRKVSFTPQEREALRGRASALRAALHLSVPVGQPLETMTGLEVHLGGAESNVCAALAALGRRCAWASRLPDNALGR